VSEQERRQLEEVAKEWSDALIASYRACLREDDLSSQPDVESIRRFCNMVTAYLDERAVEDVASPRDVEEGQRDDEPLSAGDREPPVGAYMDFMGALIEYYRSDAMTAYPASGGGIEKRY
jgi:hypothetical protein